MTTTKFKLRDVVTSLSRSTATSAADYATSNVRIATESNYASTAGSLVPARLRAVTWLATLLLTIAFGWTGAWAFDFNGYKSKVEATLVELNAKKLPDSNATLARLDEMIVMGSAAAKEYAKLDPKYAKLMDAAIADAQAMKGMTDAQLEDKWGEKGYGGDAVGIPLKTLSESSAPRNYLELIVAPVEQYIYIKRWQSVKKARLLEQA